MSSSCSLAEKIERWLTLICQDQTVHSLQEEHQARFDGQFRQGEGPVSELLCPRPKDGFVAIRDRHGGVETRGFCFSGKLVANVSKVSAHSAELFFCKKGVRHGFSRLKKNTEHGLVTMMAFGRYSNGFKQGTWWEALEGGGFRIAEFDQGERNDRDETFLYPDYATALTGRWSSKKQKKHGDHAAVPDAAAVVVDLAMCDGVLTLTLKTASGESVTSSSDQSETDEEKKQEDKGCAICDRPLIRDPYESRHVSVRKSLIPGAGEGLFCLQPIRRGRIVAYFNGVVTPRLRCEQSEYSIAFDEDSVLDIPSHCRSIE